LKLHFLRPIVSAFWRRQDGLLTSAMCSYSSLNIVRVWRADAITQVHYSPFCCYAGTVVHTNVRLSTKQYKLVLAKRPRAAVLCSMQGR